MSSARLYEWMNEQPERSSENFDHFPPILKSFQWLPTALKMKSTLCTMADKPASAGPHLQHLILSLPPLSWSSGQSDPVPPSSRLPTLSCLQHFAVGIFLAQNTLLLETPLHPWSLMPMRGFPRLPYPRDFLQALQLSSLFPVYHSSLTVITPVCLVFIACLPWGLELYLPCSLWQHHPLEHAECS